MATVELTKDNFEEVISNNDMVIVDFWASWCGPCKTFAPVFEATSEKYPDIVFGKVNTEEQMELAGAFDVGDKHGALVAEVAQDSPGEKAGVQAGDVITSLAGSPVRNMQDFYNIEGQLPIGKKKGLEFLRGAKPLRASVVSIALKRMDGGLIDPRFKGARFEELPPKMRADQVKGVLLTKLDSNSELARNGLRPGDIVTGANRQLVQNLKDLQRLVQGSGGPILLQIRRSGGDYIARID